MWLASAADTNDSFKLTVNADSASNPSAPPDAPSWTGVLDIDTDSTEQKYVELVNIGSDVVGVVWQRTTGILAAAKVTFSGGSLSVGSISTVTSLTMQNGLISVTSDDSTNAHVIYRDGSNVLHRTIDFNPAAPTIGGTANTVFSGAVDTLSLGQDQTSSPDDLYAFYVKNSANTDICWQTSPVDTISFTGETCPDDTGTDALDYLVAGRKDWNNDSLIQVIYTRQTSADIRFIETPELLWLFFGLAPFLPLVLRKRRFNEAKANI